MRKSIKVIFIIIYITCVCLIYLSTIDKYDVLYEMDPQLTHGSLTNDDSDGKLFSTIILFIILIFQSIFLFLEKSRKWKCIIIAMTILAFLFFLVR